MYKLILIFIFITIVIITANSYEIITTKDKKIINIEIKGKEMAQIAPLYDLDWSLNAPINYRYLGIFPEEDQNRIKRFCEGQVLQQYMRVFGEQFDWFNDFAKEFARNVQSMDLRKELQEQKGITTVHEEQLQHYQAFIQQQNNIIQRALETRSDGANTHKRKRREIER